MKIEFEYEPIEKILNGATDIHLIELLNEIGKDEQPLIQKYADKISDDLIVSGEPIESLWNGNAERKFILEKIICFECSMRWEKGLESKIQLANH